MKIDLINCLPQNKDGKRSLLPKQQEFFDHVITNKTSKYVAYVGGIGSGKSIVGCLTMLAMAIQKSGDYLVSRQFMPELKVTTYKTLLEMIPKELLIEHRVADALVRIRAVDGVSTIYFRPLEEPDKFRSMNLNAFYIDECNQVSEEAFMLLQGRLRGSGWRKGIVTSNPAGHDWVWRWFADKEHITQKEVRLMFHLVRAPSTENVHLPEGYIEAMMATWSKDRIEREIMGSFDSFEGKIYEEFRPEIHCITPFAIPKEWPRYIGIDHGFRNPAAWVYCAVGPDGEIYVYNEFYEKEYLIKDIVFNNLKKLGNEKITQAVIDPSVNARRGTTGESDLDEYYRWLPKEFPISMANNDVAVGIDRLKQYIRINPKSGKPLIYIFNTCKKLVHEITQYRYQELKAGESNRKAQKEEPLKVNDHACFVGSTLVLTDSGEKAIRDITPKDRVLTRKGFKRVLHAASTGRKQVYKFITSDGKSFTATEDHPVFTGRGVVPLKDLTHSDTFVKLSVWQKKLHSMALYLGRLADTTAQTVRTAKSELSRYTEKFGRVQTVAYQMGTTYTTKTRTPTITPSQIWSSGPQESTYPSTADRGIIKTKRRALNILSKFAHLQLNGINLKKVRSGIGSTVLKQLSAFTPIEPLKRLVNFAAKPLQRLAQQLIGTSSVTLIAKLPLSEKEEVYNLLVEDCPEYYVNGLLVHNCDALRYVVMLLPEPYKAKQDYEKSLKYNSMERSLYKELEKLKKPPTKKVDFGI